jgi:acetyltransferase
VINNNSIGRKRIMGSGSAPDVMGNIINPKSIAIIGASESTMYGKGIPEALKKNNYKGKIFLVNPKRETLFGVNCYKNVKDIEDSIDLAIIIVARKFVLEALQDCVSRNVKGALIITAGFGEADDEGKQLEQKIKDFSINNNSPVWGPNCAGFANFKDGIIATLLREEGREPLTGRAGFVSQSGALMMSLVGVARDKGLGLNYAISTGNEANLESTDFMEYMLEDDSTKTVAAFVEGIKDMQHFKKVADIALDKGKPLCILKVGRSELGERAAVSHTGSMTGADDAYEVLFKEKGIIRVVDTDELMDMAKICALAKLPKSDGIAIITSSGGTGSLSADLCADYHLRLPEMSPTTMQELMNLEQLLTFDNLSNPIDVRGQGIRAMDKVLPIVIGDANYGVAIVSICFSGVGSVANSVATIVRDAILNVKTDKPIFVLWIGRKERRGGFSEIEEGYEILEKADIPVFSEPHKCFKTIRKLLDFREARERYIQNKTIKAIPHQSSGKTFEVKKILDSSQSGLTEYEGKKILSLYGIPVTREEITSSLDEAIAIAEQIGYPVALKVVSPHILHKTEVGGLVLNIKNCSELEKAYNVIQERVRSNDKTDGIRGVLVQQMVPPGVEVILGMKRDPQFGPIILFGVGGIFVEVFKDVARRFPPIYESDAHEMIKEIKGYKVLQGARTKKEFDIKALVDAITNFSTLCVENYDLIEAIDINPLIVGEKGMGVCAVDALMVKSKK